MAAAQMPASGGRGESLYLSQCSFCHGQRGEGGRGPSLTRVKLRRAPDDISLARVIRRGIPDTGMPGTLLSESETRDIAAHVRRLGRIPPAVLKGNPTSGEKIYRAQGCVRCHTIAGRGGAFGPDLSAVGTRRSPAHLRQSLLEPEADVPSGFLQIRVATFDGRTFTAVRVNEDSFSIQLRVADGTLYSFWKSELQDLHKDFGKSPMDSYRDALAPEQLDDLVAYLAGLQDGS
jgi:putative heme-binding domain-containing protein